MLKHHILFSAREIGSKMGSEDRNTRIYTGWGGDMPKFERYALYLFLLALILAAYSSVFTAGFIWDDDAYVLNNRLLRSIDGLYRMWFEPEATPQYYPLVFTLFWVQFHVWGLDPLGYHLVNILLHTANALLLCTCLRKLEISAPFVVACIFALHPVNVESVAWVTELKNILSMFFSLISFLLYWRFNETSPSDEALKRRSLYAGALLSFMLALFSKSVAGSLPAMILLLMWWKDGRFHRHDVVRLTPFFVLSLVLGLNTARLEVSHVLAYGPEWNFTFMERVLIAGRSVWFYTGKLLWPHPLVFNYERWQIDTAVWWQYLFPLGVLSVVAVLWFMRGKIGRGALAGYLFFIGTIFPALGFFNIYPMRYSFVADHFQYAASIGLMVLFVSGLTLSMGKIRRLPDITSAGVFSLIVVLLGLITWQQGKIYQDRMSLFTDTIEKNPRSWLSYSNRGRDYALSGREDLALLDIEKSLAINPDDADSLQVRGAIALKRRDFERALADMDRSIELYPFRFDYIRNRSLAHRNAGRMVEALADASRALELAPDDYQSYLIRAGLFAKMGKLSLAWRDLHEVVRLGYPLSDGEVKRIMDLDESTGNR